MNKSKVMEALLDPSCNVPSEIVSFVGNNLPANGKEELSVVFDHSENSVFEACGLLEDDVKGFTKALNTHMNSIPEGQRTVSKAVEFVFNSTNPKWKVICIVSALKHLENSSEKDSDDTDDIKAMILKILKKRSRE